MTMNRSTKILHAFIWLGLAIAFGMILIVIYWLVYPHNTAEIKSIKTTKLVYQQGEQLSIEIDRCVYKSYPAVAIRRFEDSLIYTMPPIQINPKEGCFVEPINTTTIPENLPPGKYVFDVTIIREVNPLKDEIDNWKTNEFEVVEKL